MKKVLCVLGCSLAFALVGCGGGGGNSGSSGDGSTVSPIVSSLIYQLDKIALSNSGADEATLTVTALDSANNPVPNSNVSVSVDSGVYTPDTSISDAAGKSTGKISIGDNKSNREIVATIAAGGQTTKAVLPVTGSQIALSLVPAAPAPGASVKVSVKVTDVNGSGIPKTAVKLSGSLGFSQTLNTDALGNAMAELRAAPISLGIYTVDAGGSGVVVSEEVQVLNPDGLGIPDAIGTISSASLAINSNTIEPNASGFTTQRASLRAVFQNASNQAIQNVRARFEIVPPVLGSGEAISTAVGTVYSNGSGQATSEYIAGTRSSPTDGVRIRVCYGISDVDIANGACPRFVSATMTVAKQPLSITLGDNNKLERGANDLTYIKKFDIAVADAAGNAVTNAQISAVVDLTVYQKGEFSGVRTSCINEDINRNGFLDAGEDIDGDNSVNPRKADVVLSFVGERVTGSNGRATVQVEYPMNVATWLFYTVKVTTNVAGSEGSVQKAYRTNFIEGDQINGSFLTAPYGVNDCSTPN